MARDKKGCAGCLTSIVAIVLAIVLLGSCGGGLDPETTPGPEDPAVVQEQHPEEEPSEEVSNSDTEEEPEQEIIELEPVFVDPYGGTEEETPEEPAPEPEAPETQQPAASEPEPVTPEPPAVQDSATEPPTNPESDTPTVSDPLAGETSTPEPEPAPEPEEIVPPATDIPVGNETTIVYITETGAKYHHGGCRHLADSKIETTLDAAISAGYTPCGTCH